MQKGRLKAMEVNKQYADVKQQTIELYDSLPQDEEGRKSRLDIRDKIIELNYSFFGYVASRTYINNPSIEYEDKFQSALCNFCKCWWWYRWAERYRTDLSFSSFFTLRLGEMIERELNEVKYSLRRSLCMKAGAQLGKHWGQVRYEDLAHVNLPADEMNSLKAMFGAVYWADLADHEMYLEAPDNRHGDITKYLTDKYDTVEELLIHEMVSNESQLSDDDLHEISELYSIDYWELKSKLPKALEILHDRLVKGQLDY